MANLTEKAQREMDELANSLFDAIAREDVDAVRKVYAPDVVYWMNAMPESLGLDALLNLVSVFHQKVKNLHYEVESREFFPGGFVQRCRIAGEAAATGKSFAVPLCLVIYVENGRIARLYEYIDPASLLPFLA